MLKKEVLAYLKKNNFVPSKKMGQNFLINDAIKRNIVNCSNIKENDNVLEIGPGLGAITQYIHNITDHFIAVELDKRLAEHLSINYPTINLINDDILKLDLHKLFNEKKWNNIKVIANLPYSISSKIIIKLLLCTEISEINILVQREMGERIMASPNTHEYNAFSVLVQKFASITTQFKVGSLEFIPSPQIESIFISIKKYNNVDIDFFKYDKFLRKCFCARRKKLTNNLSNYYAKDNIITILEKLNINLNTRAEELDNTQFSQIYKILGD